MDRQAIYDRIKAAETAQISKHPDAATVDTIVTEKAAIQYQKAVRNIFGTDHGTGQLIMPTNPAQIVAKVQEKAGTVSTLKKYARSVRYAALMALSKLLNKADAAQCTGNWHEVERIVSSDIFHAYTVLSQMLPADYRIGWKPKRKRHGKKSSISKLPEDWREQMAKQVHGQFRIPSMVALLTGCRPAEVEKGVLIERIDGALYATIKSAKHTVKAGQEQRRFRIADHPVTKMLMDFMDESNETRHKKLVEVIHGNSLTTHLRAAARKLWPERKESITTYSTRHAISADCKKAIYDGADPDLASKVLGHIVDKTSSYYGALLQSGGISVAPTDVTVPQEVRHKVRERNKQRAIKQGMIKNAKLDTQKS
jgi:integrase